MTIDPMTPGAAIRAIVDLGDVANEARNGDARMLPVMNREVAQMLAQRRGKSRRFMAQVSAEIERQRAGGPIGAGATRVGGINGKDFYVIDEAHYEHRPPTNYQAVPAGTLLNPDLGPPRAMPLMPNLRPMVMCIRILLMQRGVKLSWY